jgi:4-alpha-glucanotransferase
VVFSFVERELLDRINGVSRRSAGVLLPLFSIRGPHSWGVGELPDLGAAATWLSKAQLRLWMLLPLLEAAQGQDSPYFIQSAFAIDPVYIALDQVEDFAELGGEPALAADDRDELDSLRARQTIDWGAVRRLKEKWLWRSFERFSVSGAAVDSRRARDLARFREAHSVWLADYSLFRALKEAEPSQWWRVWDEPLREREPQALARARARFSTRCAFFEYLQYLAYHQLRRARAEARTHGILLGGDLPFTVAEDSADAWAHQTELRFDASVGTPPDAYSDQGQDWGMPAYCWDALEDQGYSWLRRRGDSAAEAFDLVRVDHVVGFYRTYVRPKDGSQPFFSPPGEPSQIEQGRRVMEALRQGGAALVAEDLGTVPPFVRRSLTELGIPGYRVLRWEQDEGVYRDPALWPALSVGATGTHDTSTMAAWWEELPQKERKAICCLPALRSLDDAEAGRFSPAAHQALLATVYGSGSSLLAIPVQDLLGTRDRINLPGTVGPHNWSYRLPWTSSELLTDPWVCERTEALASLARESRRELALRPGESSR